MDVTTARLRLSRAREAHSEIVRLTNDYLFGELAKGNPDPDPFTVRWVTQDGVPRLHLVTGFAESNKYS